jgi:phosphoesterase RecJ-like protein
MEVLMAYDQAWKTLTAAQRILMTTHAKPDGDGLGSLAALYEYLTSAGKTVRVILPTPPADKYRFIRGFEKFEILGRDVTVEKLPRDFDLLLVVDTCTWEQLSDIRDVVQSYRDRLLVIDHHATRDDLQQQELVDVEAGAAGQIIMRLLERQGVVLTAGLAESLFVSIASDTGWFRFPKVTPEVYRMAARLVELGVTPWILYEKLYQTEPLGRLKLVGDALSTLKVTPEGDVAYFWLTQEMFAQSGARLADTENIIDQSQKIVGVVVGLLFVEVEGGTVRVSLRSKHTVDVAAIAAAFGGGGHARASGCRVPGPLAEARKRVLNAVYAAMGRPPRDWA